MGNKSILEKLGSSEGRLTTGAALIGAIVVGLWPDQSREFDPAKASAIALTAIAWLYAELGASGSVSSHDVNLFKKIEEFIGEDVEELLLNQDFYASAPTGPIGKLNHFSTWKGADHEFLDKRLQNEWTALGVRVTELSNLFVKHLGPNSIGNRYTVKVKNGGWDQQPEHLWKAAEAINEKSATVYKQLQTFKTSSRKRLSL